MTAGLIGLFFFTMLSPPLLFISSFVALVFSSHIVHRCDFLLVIHEIASST